MLIPLAVGGAWILCQTLCHLKASCEIGEDQLGSARASRIALNAIRLASWVIG